MKSMYYVLVMMACLAAIGLTSSDATAIEAYFDTEISTELEYESGAGTVVIRMIDEKVPPILPDTMYEQELYVEIIFDASKTMEEPDINGIPKITVAKQLVSILASYFPARDTRFALRINGAKYDNNCFDTEMVIPFRKGNGQQILDAVMDVEPKGLSPLTYSIRQVLQDFSEKKGSKIVFVITDGLETCDVEPTDACTSTMDLLLDAEFDGTLNILGVNTIHDNAKELLGCLASRSGGTFLDSNRHSGRQLAQLIQESSQLRYNISRVLDTQSLSEGKILGLINRRIGDVTKLGVTAGSQGGTTDVLIQPGIIRKEAAATEIREIRIEEVPEENPGYSRHELPPGVYKIEFVTTPPMVSYFVLDEEQELTIGVVESGEGYDLYDRIHLALGNRYYENGQIEQALEEYQKVLDVNDRDMNAHLNMGIIYQDILKNNEKAAFHYKTYLELQGPRQEDVSVWLRQARGLPTEEEEVEAMIRERKEEQARKAAAKLAEEARKRQEKERQKALAAYEEILTANPPIRELSREAIFSAAPVVDVVISSGTPDFRAEEVALDVGKRMNLLLDRRPEILVYREGREDVPVKHAVFDQAQGRYVIIN